MDPMEVWRMLPTGDRDEGTPIIDRVLMGTVDCRIDSIRSRRSDMAFRGNVSTTHENFAIIFAPPDADIKNDDQLRPINNPEEQWLVIEISRAQGPTYVHHLEVMAARIMGET
jgi:hypothetical protein